MTALVWVVLTASPDLHGQQSGGLATASDGQGKKNVLVLLADDLGWGDIGLHGSEATTTNIDQLARDGVELTRFYAFPACSPARAAMLTGRFPHRYGISGPVRSREVGLPIEERLLPSVFQSAGYHTSLIGKWHLGSLDEKSHPIERGFDHFYGFMGASIDYFDHAVSSTSKRRRKRPDWQRNGEQIKEEGYSTNLLVDEAIRMIKDRKESKPFCIVLSFNAPHSPFQAPKDIVAKYDKRLSGQSAIYAAMLESLDIGIGRILKVIDQQQLRDDTIVVFASDNGASRVGNNDPFRGAKREVYEGGIHVPCVIRAPGIKPGTKSDQLTGIHDLFPTLATGANISLGESKRPLDGLDLWSNFADGKQDSRGLVIAEEAHAFFQDNWKLIKAADGAAELYDLAADPLETKDLSKSETAIFDQMSALLDEYKKSVADDLPIPDSFKKKSALEKAPLSDATKQHSRHQSSLVSHFDLKTGRSPTPRGRRN